VPRATEGEQVLPARLAARDHRRQEDARGDIRRRDEEDRELHVPRAHEVEREPRGEVDAEEARQVGPVVLRGGAYERLHEEERRHHEEEPGRGALRGREGDVARRPEGKRRLLAAVPAQEAPAAEGGEEEPDPAEQRNQREDAPDDHVRRRPVIDERLRRPVVRVRVVVSRPFRRGGPGRPREVGGQLLDLVRVRDRLTPEPVRVAVRSEEPRVVLLQPAESCRLCTGQLERPRLLRVPVRPEVVGRPRPRNVRALAAVPVTHEERSPVEIVGCEIRAEVGAVPEDRPVLHEAVAEKELLTGADVGAREDFATGGVDDANGNRRLGLVRPVRHQPEHEEAEEQDEGNGLHPPAGDEKRPALLGNGHS
jgi:hypothetical protein